MVRTAEATHLIEDEPEAVGISSERLENVTRLTQRYIDDGRLPGAITMLARHDRVVHFETYGSMHDDPSRPTRHDDIFRIYSMTKPIVSVALMTLYEEGLFQLEDPASKYIPQFKDLRVFESGTAQSFTTRAASREMTVRDILMHTSGLTAYGNDHPVSEMYEAQGIQTSSTRSGTVADAVDKLGRLPLRCDPGSEWNYGASTDVVGHLIEVLSGQRLDDFLAERVLGPLGMMDTGFYVQPESIDRFVPNYGPLDGAKKRYVRVDGTHDSVYATPRAYLSGAGGLTSTAPDYMRFVKMLARGGELDGARILGPRTIDLMRMNHLPVGKDLGDMNKSGPTESARDGVGFGLGFAAVIDQAKAQGLSPVGEYYWGGAASTAFFVCPAEDMVMVFMTQIRPSSTYAIRRELRAAIYSALID